ncbi:MAG: penicillin-binding protein [Clostridiales bacterium]|nr:penicillin-binding protein [Clostridiales bacterium]
MKKLQGRTWFVLLFILLLIAGSAILVGMYFVEGRDWVAFSANSHLYTNGRIATGAITDRNGVLLYDGETGDYADESSVRIATLHAVGDQYGNIATGAKVLFDEYMASYNPITGVTSGGNQVSLTIDADLNVTAWKALDGRNGTVAVYNYETGEIVCMVSSPTFDPYDSEEVLAAVNEGDSRYDSVYLNRFLSSSFTPGSIFKIVTTAAAIEQIDDLDDFTFTCTGSLEVDGDTVTCPSVHGTQTLAEALANSCNCAYATLALELGGDTLQTYASRAGLLNSVTVNGLSSAKGSYTVPTSSSDLAWSGVGQYTDLVNPCSMLVLMGCIAGDGEAAVPTLLKSVTGSFGLPAAILTTSTTSIDWEEETCEELKTLMRNNVTSHYGQDQFGDLAVCAKSGTAEVSSSDDPHAWFVGFIDDEDYPYAFVVLVENGGWGSSTAGSIAATVLTQLCS